MLSLIFKVAAFAVALYASYSYLHRRRASCKAPRRARTIEEAQTILRNSDLPSRAIFNQRLVLTFHINNAFTTTNSAYYRLFLAKSKKLLRTSDSEWKELADLAARYVVDTLTNNKPQEIVSLIPLVQRLVFKLVILKFFPDALHASDAVIVSITSGINSLWLASKTPAEMNTIDFKRKQTQLFGLLEAFFQKDINGNENPLNIILPAYETLWRVVLRCFLEVRFNQDQNTLAGSAALFERFLEAPTQNTLNNQCPRISISIHNIVNETLRLYPPTRRIYRHLNPHIIRSSNVAVDIEFLHRDPITWGANASKFDPRRWIDRIDDRKKSAFMPFGAGKFECPAKAFFGPMMIGILAGVLVIGVGKEWELVGEDVKVAVFGEEPLEGGREAYAGLKLKKVKEQEGLNVFSQSVQD